MWNFGPNRGTKASLQRNAGGGTQPALAEVRETGGTYSSFNPSRSSSALAFLIAVRSKRNPRAAPCAPATSGRTAAETECRAHPSATHFAVYAKSTVAGHPGPARKHPSRGCRGLKPPCSRRSSRIGWNLFGTYFEPEPILGIYLERRVRCGQIHYSVIPHPTKNRQRHIKLPR